MTAGDHLMPPQQHVYNGLARPADELMFARDNRSDIGTTGQTTRCSENIMSPLQT